MSDRSEMTATEVSQQIRWVKLRKYCELTGDTRESVHAKRARRIWTDGVHCTIAPDGGLWVNLEEAEKPLPPPPELDSELTRKELLWLLGEVASATDPKMAPGVYLLFDESRACVYVGQSQYVLRRIGGHGRKEFVFARMIECADLGRRHWLEARLIRALRPRHNVAIPELRLVKEDPPLESP